VNLPSSSLETLKGDESSVGFKGVVLGSVNSKRIAK
jgi:hypothetical protein